MIFPMKNEYRKKIGMLDIFKINFDFSESIKLPFAKLDIRKVMMNIKAKNIAVHSKICLRFFHSSLKKEYDFQFGNRILFLYLTIINLRWI